MQKVIVTKNHDILCGYQLIVLSGNSSLSFLVIVDTVSKVWSYY